MFMRAFLFLKLQVYVFYPKHLSSNCSPNHHPPKADSAESVDAVDCREDLHQAAAGEPPDIAEDGEDSAQQHSDKINTDNNLGSWRLKRPGIGPEGENGPGQQKEQEADKSNTFFFHKRLSPFRSSKQQAG